MSTPLTFPDLPRPVNFNQYKPKFDSRTLEVAITPAFIVAPLLLTAHQIGFLASRSALITTIALAALCILIGAHSHRVAEFNRLKQNIENGTKLYDALKAAHDCFTKLASENFSNTAVTDMNSLRKKIDATTQTIHQQFEGLLAKADGASRDGIELVKKHRVDRGWDIFVSNLNLKPDGNVEPLRKHTITKLRDLDQCIITEAHRVTKGDKLLRRQSIVKWISDLANV